MKTLVFGEILWDIYPNGRFLGGAPLNFAAHLARHGEEVHLLSSLGNDELGAEAIDRVKKWNISTKHIKILDNIPTGKCVVTLDENKIPSYDLWCEVAYDSISCGNIPDNFDVLYFGTLSLRSDNNFAELRKLTKSHRFSEIFVDMNIRPPFYNEETVNFAVETATILKISEEELSTIANMLGMHDYAEHSDFSQRLADKYDNLRCIIITLGKDGAFALRCNDRCEHTCYSEVVEVKSTVGAGDSFSAAFLHMYLKGSDISSCLKYANKLASFVVSRYDAVPEYST